MHLSQKFSSLNYFNPRSPTENVRNPAYSTLQFMIWICLFMPRKAAGFAAGVEQCFGARLQCLERLLGRSSFDVWAFVCSMIFCGVFLVDVSRAAAAVPGPGLSYPGGPGSGCFLPLVGRADPSLPSAFPRLPSVALCARWPSGRALTLLAGRPGRSLGGPVRHPSAQGRRRP